MSITALCLVHVFMITRLKFTNLLHYASPHGLFYFKRLYIYRCRVRFSPAEDPHIAALKVRINRTLKIVTGLALRQCELRIRECL